MPPVRQNAPQGTGKVILKHGTRKVLVRYPTTYDAALAAARKEFKLGLFQKLDLRVDMAELEPDSTQGAVDISAGSWDLLGDCNKTPVVEVHKCEQATVKEEISESPPNLAEGRGRSGRFAVGDVESVKSSAKDRVPPSPPTRVPLAQPLVLSKAADAPPLEPAPAAVSPDAEKKIKISVFFEGRTMNILVKPRCNVDKIKEPVAAHMGVCADDLRMIWDGNLMWGTFEDVGVEDGDQIFAFREQRGGKPVIYLFSPTPVIASVHLSLVPEWSFSAIYPVAPVSRKGLESVSWDVDVRPDGTLLDKRTASEVAYLYWEATTNTARPLSPPLESGVATFNPVSALVAPSNAVVLDIADVPSYLDKSLDAMALHTEARTSFITYWLPAMLKHKHIALRFLPQSAYEPAAPMRVTPAPDVVTRVFMLFRGVSEFDAIEWLQAAPELWKDVVGVEEAKARDAKLFRVLEWGGMEVKY